MEGHSVGDKKSNRVINASDDDDISLINMFISKYEM